MPTQILTQDYLKTCFDYRPDTGVLTWKHRPKEHFKNEHGWNTFNSLYAWEEAGGDDGQGYLRVRINGKKHAAHRLIWCWVTGSWPKNQIDHKDHNRANNRWANLREATHQENQRNASRRSDNTSGVTGVTWHNRDQIWQARIAANGKLKHLGSFDDKIEAICARKSAEAKYNYHKNHGMG